MSAFGCPLCIPNGMLRCKERYTLLLKCFKHFIRCMRMIGRAVDSIYKPRMVHTMSFLLKITLKFHVKCQRLGTYFLKGNGMLCCKGQHTLLLECLITFLRYTGIIPRASGSTSKPVMVNSVPLLTKTTLKFHVKYQLLGPLSEQEMGCCDARKDIYYCVGVP